MNHLRFCLPLSALLLASTPTGLCGDNPPLTWDKYFQSVVTGFRGTNRAFIENTTNLHAVDTDWLVGLEIRDRPLAEWSCPNAALTNIRYLDISTSAPVLGQEFFDAILRYPALEHLVLKCSSAHSVPPCMGSLTNLAHLRSLSMYAYAATEITPEIYGLKAMEELLLCVGTVHLPDGISRLPELRRVTLRVQQGKTLRRLQGDFEKSSVEYLTLLNVGELQHCLPVLPVNTRLLEARRCGLEHVPEGWYPHRTVEAFDLSDNAIQDFPVELLKNPALEILGLDWNEISNVPPLHVSPSRRLSIGVVGNPIKHFAPDNEQLVESSTLLR